MSHKKQAGWGVFSTDGPWKRTVMNLSLAEMYVRLWGITRDVSEQGKLPRNVSENHQEHFVLTLVGTRSKIWSDNKTSNWLVWLWIVSRLFVSIQSLKSGAPSIYQTFVCNTIITFYNKSRRCCIACSANLDRTEHNLADGISAVWTVYSLVTKSLQWITAQHLSRW